MEIMVSDETKSLKEKNLDLIEEIIIASAEELELDDNFELSITIVDNQKIKEMNKEYRSIDQVTDVISFALEDNDKTDFDIFFKEIDNPLPRLLGDIFISIDKAKEQALEYGHSFERELGFLLVHGFLHLNGYDHQTKAEEKEMFQLQEKILKEYGLER
ncbi:MAG: rRNA maturation RNase YbeY [Atopostipes sp.]|nr:rRNA maturation RNase YbeY [Atopostipes sp.]